MNSTGFVPILMLLKTLLLELCDQGRCLDELGHRKGPRRLLEKMAEQHRYPEAIVSLGLTLYTSEQESLVSFAKYLERHKEQSWLLECLARNDASSSEKEQLFLETMSALPQGRQWVRVVELTKTEREARTSKDVARLQRLFESRESKIWRALAANPATPPEILSQIEKVEDVANAQEIRQLARDNLRQRTSRSHGNHP